jgi:hypothetical protein
LTLSKILSDKMGVEIYEIFSEFRDITLEMPEGKVIR